MPTVNSYLQKRYNLWDTQVSVIGQSHGVKVPALLFFRKWLHATPRSSGPLVSGHMGKAAPPGSHSSAIFWGAAASGKVLRFVTISRPPMMNCYHEIRSLKNAEWLVSLESLLLMLLRVCRIVRTSHNISRDLPKARSRQIVGGLVFQRL